MQLFGVVSHLKSFPQGLDVVVGGEIVDGTSGSSWLYGTQPGPLIKSSNAI